MAGAISREYEDQVRPDWKEIMVDMVRLYTTPTILSTLTQRCTCLQMEAALYHKFIQHEVPRKLLLSTRDQNLMFSDSEDGFWGDGRTGQGYNEVGKALMRIRERLQEAGYT